VAEEKLPFEVDDAIVLLLGVDPGPKETQGTIQGVTRLEKLVFLLEKEGDSSDWLSTDADFEAYNYGPFSKDVYRAVDVLALAGLVEDSAKNSKSADDTWEEMNVIGNSDPEDAYVTRDFRLTALGQRYFEALKSELPHDDFSKVVQLRKKFAGWPLRALIRYVYRNHDDYTHNSLIRDDILGKRGSE
jgi:uncharacterized protein YwgA